MRLRECASAVARGPAAEAVGEWNGESLGSGLLLQGLGKGDRLAAQTGLTRLWSRWEP